MKRVKSISFNDNNAEEKEMLKFVRRRNFSKYVKTLIRADMQRKQQEKTEVKKDKPKEEPVKSNPIDQAHSSPVTNTQKPLLKQPTQQQRFKSQNGGIKFDLR